MAAALDMPVRVKVAMVACGYIPFLNVAVMATISSLAFTGVFPAWAAWLAPAWLFLIPPIVVRVALRKSRPFGTPLGGVSMESRQFLLWWFTSQWQAIFNRLPAIEEAMRLVPGLYSAWLRLWGARVGRFVYWTPGLRILDRSLINVGGGAAFGAGVRISPHVLMMDADGRPALRVGVVKIGAGALVGAYSILPAGCWVAAGEATPATLAMRPFTGWRGGRRVRPGEGADAV